MDIWSLYGNVEQTEGVEGWNNGGGGKDRRGQRGEGSEEGGGRDGGEVGREDLVQ